MFRTSPAAEPLTPPDMDPPEQLISLVELELSLDVPPEGWAAHLAHRGVEITLDDIGRASVARADARRLLIEQRELEARGREKAAELERQAVEADQQFRAQLGVGVPASAFPHGMSYAEAIASAELDTQQYSPRASVAQDLLDRHTPGEIVFHSLAEPAEE